MSRLESRARWLLHAYPRSYRADRGEEIIGTLLEAGRPGQSWPAPRDTWSLLTGGLRARAARNQLGPLGTYLRLAVLLAAALWLAASPALDLELWTRVAVGPLPGAVYAAWGLLLSATIAAPWVARRGITVSLALTAAIALGLWGHRMVEPNYPFGVALFVVPPLALAAAVATEPTRPPRCWLWIPASAFAASTLLLTRVVLVRSFSARVLEGSLRASWLAVPAYTVIACGLACAVVLWLAVDARPFTAVVVVLEWLIVPDFVYRPEPAKLVIAALLLVPIGLAGLAIGFLRRKVPRTTTPGL